MRNEVPFLLAASLALSSGCAFGAAGRHDQPAPPETARAELVLTVDLEPSADCEERFDLGLYRDRAVERVEWDDRRGKCQGRRIAIRYLAAERLPADLVAAVHKLSRRAEPTREGAR